MDTVRPSLFDAESTPCLPRRPDGFQPVRIVLARGSVSTPSRKALSEAICRAYPEARVVDATGQSHMQIDLGVTEPLGLHYAGKQTLVLGEHKSAVRFSDETGNGCPNYWHFSLYGFCPYDCAYCYLAGTRGIQFSPAVKVFVNLDEILAAIERVAGRWTGPGTFYCGKLQDGLALDPLTGYSRRLVAFFARHPTARQVILTKSAGVDNLLGLDHRGRTILSWSLNPPVIRGLFESATPSIEARLAAMARCAAAGYPVRAVIMPIVPVEGWRDVYETFLGVLLTTVRLERITLGGICSFPSAHRLMEAKIGPANAISLALSGEPSPDGRKRYARSQRIEVYRHLLAVIRDHDPAPPVGLCLEEPAVFEALNMTSAAGRCNCVL